MTPLVRPLRVLHFGPAPDTGHGSGIDVASWPLLSAQVAAGISVTLLIPGELEEDAYSEAARVGVNLAVVSGQRFQTLPREALATVSRIRPDVVHFHSVFIPAYAQLARMLLRLRIPYFLSPHGGLNLWRGKLKKGIYGAAVEKPYFRRADTIFVLTSREQKIIEAWLGGREQLRFLELPNPIPATVAGTSQWECRPQSRLVYLGRFDVIKKGLDRLVEIGRYLPDVEIRAYGNASGSERRGFQRLCRRGIPENVRFCDPVHGDAKQAALTSTTMYIQPSRDEGFAMSIVEAMRLAVPVAVTRGCHLSNTIAEMDLGIVLPDDPVNAAAEVASALSNSDRLRHWSRAGRAWTIDALSPQLAAKCTIAAYEDAIRNRHTLYGL